jgi:DNA-binding transcriptional LysR family regulator
MQTNEKSSDGASQHLSPFVLMELYQLRGFTAVAELGHLTRAAERLHLSQPALSAQIKALEDELGVQLFERSPTGMTLTAAGKQLLPEATKVLTDAASLHGKARAMEGSVGGHVRVGTLSDPGFIRLADFLAKATERFPLLEIELNHEVSGAAFEKVRDGVLDASFYYGDLAHRLVGSIPLREIAYRVTGPAVWRDKIERAGWADIAALPWLMAPSISTHHVLAARLFEERGSAPTTLIEADNEAVIRSLVASGLGVALIREDLAQQGEAAGQLVVLPEVRLTTVLRFIYSNEKREEPALRALIDVIRDVWRSAPTGSRATIGRKEKARRIAPPAP